MRIRGDPESKSYAVFIRCVFDNNLALNGAGVDVAHRGNGYFLGCTFQSNSADGEGGAVYLEYRCGSEQLEGDVQYLLPRLRQVALVARASA